MDENERQRRMERLDRLFREATDKKKKGKLDESEAELRGLHERYGDLGAVVRQAMVGINLAQLLQQKGALDDAVAAYEQAAALAESAGDRRRVGLCLSGLSTICLERGETERCEEYAGGALEIFRSLDDAPGIGNQLGNLGLLRQAQGRLEEAVAYFSEAARLFVEAGHAPGAIGVLQCIGEVHRRQGEFDDAQTAHEQALDLATQAGIDLAKAHSHRALGHIRRLRGDLEAAERHIREGLDIHRSMGDVRGYLAALIDLGTVEFAQGRGAVAISHLDECARRAEELGLVTPWVKALLNRALYRLDTPQLDAVRADLGRARELLDKVGDPQGWSIWSITSSRVLIRRGDWDEADRVLEAELQRAERANLAPVRGAILGLRGSIESLRGRAKSAMRLFDESESQYRGLGDVDGARMAVLAKLRLLAETGRLEQVSPALESLLETCRREPVRQPVMEAEILTARASVYDLASDFAAAARTASEAQSLYHDAGFALAEIGARLIAHQARTNACRFQGAASRAEDIDDLRALVRETAALQSPTTDVVARCTLADALTVRGERGEARELAAASLEAARELDFKDGIARSLQVLARAELDRSKALDAFRIWRSLDSAVRADRLRDEWDLTAAEIESAPIDADD